MKIEEWTFTSFCFYMQIPFDQKEEEVKMEFDLAEF